MTNSKITGQDRQIIKNAVRSYMTTENRAIYRDRKESRKAFLLDCLRVAAIRASGPMRSTLHGHLNNSRHIFTALKHVECELIGV